MRVVVAPDKFKGSLTAAEVVDAVASGLLAVAPDTDVVRVPIADGGDGTVAAALSRGFTAVPVDALGPTGERLSSPAMWTIPCSVRGEPLPCSAPRREPALPMSTGSSEPSRCGRERVAEATANAATLLHEMGRRIASDWLLDPS